jgi:Bacterial PH domain
MSDDHFRFPSSHDDLIQIGRDIGQLPGWSVQGHIDTHLGEIRLFDGPIVMHPLAEITAPLRRIMEVSFLPAKIDMLAAMRPYLKVPERVNINNGRLCATDSRFIIQAHGLFGNPKDIIIPYSSIKDVQFEKKEMGLRGFYMHLDTSVIAREFQKRMPVPMNTGGLSVTEFSDTVLMPYAEELSRQVVSAFGITVKAPIAGFWQEIAIYLAKTPGEAAWMAWSAAQQEQMGSDFTSAFYYFLNEIAELNARNAERG